MRSKDIVQRILDANVSDIALEIEELRKLDLSSISEDDISDVVFSSEGIFIDRIFPIHSSYNPERAEYFAEFALQMGGFKFLRESVVKALKEPEKILGYYRAASLDNRDVIMNLAAEAEQGDAVVYHMIADYLVKRNAINLIKDCEIYTTGMVAREQTVDDWEKEHLEKCKVLYLNAYSPTGIKNFLGALNEKPEKLGMIVEELTVYDGEKAESNIQEVSKLHKKYPEHVVEVVCGLFDTFGKLNKIGVKTKYDALYHCGCAIDDSRIDEAMLIMKEK